MMKKIRKLQGRVIDIEKTGESMIDDEGLNWEKCIFTLEITNFSKRTPDEVVPDESLRSPTSQNARRTRWSPTRSKGRR